MSDWDYGREHGLWRNDGIPYGLNSRDYNDENDYAQESSQKNFNRSEKLAIKNGFKIVNDPKSYNGRYFVKQGLKWIHNIKALKSTIGVRLDSKLLEMGYDVQSYYVLNK